MACAVAAYAIVLELRRRWPIWFPPKPRRNSKPMKETTTAMATPSGFASTIPPLPPRVVDRVAPAPTVTHDQLEEVHGYIARGRSLELSRAEVQQRLWYERAQLVQLRRHALNMHGRVNNAELIDAYRNELASCYSRVSAYRRELVNIDAEISEAERFLDGWFESTNPALPTTVLESVRDAVRPVTDTANNGSN